MINLQKNLNNISKEFEREEGRGPIMDMAKKLLKEGKRDEAVLLILATWNFASFRYVITRFDIGKFRKVLDKLENNLKVFEGEKFETIDLHKYKKDIKKTFNSIATERITNKTGKLNSIGPTGASKILFLYNSELFIMWDSFIRREYALNNYPKNVSELYKIILNKRNNYPNYPKTSEGYFKFLCDMKKLFIEQKLTKPDNRKGWPKTIDEFNFINLSVKVGKKLKEKN